MPRIKASDFDAFLLNRPKCKEPGCDAPATKGDYCKRHYDAAAARKRKDRSGRTADQNATIKIYYDLKKLYRKMGKDRREIAERLALDKDVFAPVAPWLSQQAAEDKLILRLAFGGGVDPTAIESTDEVDSNENESTGPADLREVQVDSDEIESTTGVVSIHSTPTADPEDSKDEDWLWPVGE